MMCDCLALCRLFAQPGIAVATAVPLGCLASVPATRCCVSHSSPVARVC